VLDLEYVQLNVPKVLALLNKVRLADPRENYTFCVFRALG
jgi:hypothetical protein